MTNLQERGEAVIAEAERLWRSDIYDPKVHDVTPRGLACKRVISDLLAACGWTWPDVYPYRGDPVFQWCGIFAGACLVRAGLKRELALHLLASTDRLRACAAYASFNHYTNPPPPAGAPRRLFAELDEHSTSLPFEPAAGDILVIGPASADKHITLVESYDAERRMFHTVEGNGVGLGPDGRQRQGIVRAMRPLGGASWHARLLLRMGPDDYDA